MPIPTEVNVLPSLQSKFTVPKTSNVVNGFVVPIPTPELVILTYSWVSVLSVKIISSDPIVILEPVEVPL